MKFGVVVFPGTWSDRDCLRALGPVMGQETATLWHEDTETQDCDCIVLPGGFAYGDYLRVGAIARFAPIMGAIKSFSERGGLVIGICNGFQILVEAGMLPGALMRNDSLEFRCQWTHLRVENANTPFTQRCQPGQVIRVPISHGEGNYFADAATLDALEASDSIIFRYCAPDGTITPDANPNGSQRNIAGIINSARTVAGMMPHPERCSEALVGGEDGQLIFGSIIDALAERQVRV